MPNYFTEYKAVEAPLVAPIEALQTQQEFNLMKLNDSILTDSGVDWSFLELSLPKTEMPEFYQEPTITNNMSNNAAVSNSTNIDNSSAAKKLVQFARLFVGYKYTWGGTSPSTGFDCSGLINYVFKLAGIKLPRTADAIGKVGQQVDINNVLPGDVIVTRSKGSPSGRHIVLVSEVNNGVIKTVNALGKKYGVIENTFKDYNSIISVRRLLNGNQVSNNTQVKTTAKFGSHTDYIKTMYGYLYNALQKQGIDGKTWAPVLVALTAVESGWGNEFSRRNNNYGGIKGKGSGATATKELVNGKYVTIKDSFKKFPSIEAFADYYVSILKNKFGAFNGTPSQYAANIRARGYYTDSLAHYSNTLYKTLNLVQLKLQS